MATLTSFPKTDNQIMAELRDALARAQADAAEASRHDCRSLVRIGLGPEGSAPYVYGDAEAAILLAARTEKR